MALRKDTTLQDLEKVSTLFFMQAKTFQAMTEVVDAGTQVIVATAKTLHLQAEAGKRIQVKK